MKRARDLQIRIDRRIGNGPDLKTETYLLGVTFFCFFTAMALLFYVLLMGIPLGELDLHSDPLFWMGLAVTSVCMFLCSKYYNHINK